MKSCATFRETFTVAKSLIIFEPFQNRLGANRWLAGIIV